MGCINCYRCRTSSLCAATDLECLQILQDAGTECDGVPEGYSSLQVNALGELLICSNVGGVCNCTNISGAPGANVSTITTPGAGIIQHYDGVATIVDVDICDLIVEAYAQSPWQNLPLDAGWVAEAGQQTPQYRCLCTGEVQLRGCIEGTITDSELPAQIGTLPATSFGNNCRPSSGAVRFGAGCSGIEIATNGVITTNPSTADGVHRCFDGLSLFES